MHSLKACRLRRWPVVIALEACKKRNGAKDASSYFLRMQSKSDSCSTDTRIHPCQLLARWIQAKAWEDGNPYTACRRQGVGLAVESLNQQGQVQRCIFKINARNCF